MPKETNNNCSKAKNQKLRLREPREKKISRKGLKSMRGQPEAYDELKKIVSVSLTPTALAGIDKISRDYKISRSELLERIGRSIIQIKDRDDWANQSQS
ncbi:CopG domain protein DNA-binding domain protein (plasmid) [Nostoc sp. HK-01]|nr:CopG domain protein DNA-binding domain protein [Nostoc sp. HK-01]